MQSGRTEGLALLTVLKKKNHARSRAIRVRLTCVLHGSIDLCVVFKTTLGLALRCPHPRTPEDATENTFRTPPLMPNYRRLDVYARNVLLQRFHPALKYRCRIDEYA